MDGVAEGDEDADDATTVGGLAPSSSLPPPHAESPTAVTRQISDMRDMT